MDYSHEDLVGNINSSLNHDYAGMGGAYRPFDHHGTAVAGVIAARDNGIGVRGVAPKATVYGYNLLAGDWQQFKDINRADAMSRNRVVTAVSNNSWGPPDGPWLGYANQLWKLAVDSGIREGYDGKGVFYVFAGGNGGRGHRENPDGTLVGGHVDNIQDRGDDSNLDELANYYAVTAVCAVNDQDTRSDYSEKGANLWVCAPSNDLREGYSGIVTTENSNRYQDDFGGTSAATPIVSGVAALLRQANPDLTWRDLKLILAASARKNDAANPGWAEGARKYGSGSAADRYHFNHEYGFGVVDARAAVALARGWTNVPTLESVSAASQAAVTIPPPSGSAPQTVTTTLALNTGIRFTEFVEINTDFDHMSFRDMEIELVSPSGAVSKLAVPFNTRYYHTDELFLYVQLDGEFRFGSARHLGEDPNGQWTLRLTDHFPALGGTLRSWSIKVYGHVSRPGAPTITTPITAGADSLTVAWSAPSDSGGPAITAYDLRYIQTSADETVDANWTVVEDVWATGSGPLTYTITGLAGTTQYDVQVRGVSSVGKGAWSTAVTGTPTRATTGPCTTGVAVPGAASNPGLVADCEALLAARDTLVGSGTLNWSGSTAIGSWDGVTVDGSPLRLTKLVLRDSQLTGTIPPELGGLTSLETLALGGNQLTGPVPTWLDSLTNLQELYLWGNQLTGPIPSQLASLTNLQSLSLYDNQLSGPVPTWLGNLTNLERLHISRNQLTGPIPSQLASLTNLRELWLNDNQLTGTIPAELGSLTALEELFLSGNRLTGEIPAELGSLTNLKELLLTNNQLTGEIPAELGGLTNLQTLWLSGNQLTGCMPNRLRGIETNDLSQLGLPFCDTPGAPTIVTPNVPGDASLTVAWAAPINTGSSAITAYNLRYIETGAADKSDANWTVKEDVWAAGSGSLQYTLSGLTGGTQYDVQVRAVNAAGASAWSATVTGTTTSAVVPGAPTGLTAAVAAGKAQVVLSWIAPTDTGGAPITGYKIEASDDGNNPWTEVYTTTGDATGYTDEGADSNGPMFEVGTTRHYRVSAINSVGTGPPSNVAVTEGLVARYDANNNGAIEKGEVIAAINDYLFGEGDDAISKSDVIKLINLYLFG